MCGRDAHYPSLYLSGCIRLIITVEAQSDSVGGVVVPTASAVEGSMPEDGCKRMTDVRRMMTLLYWVEKMMFDCASSVRCAAGTATIPADDYRASDGY